MLKPAGISTGQSGTLTDTCDLQHWRQLCQKSWNLNFFLFVFKSLSIVKAKKKCTDQVAWGWWCFCGFDGWRLGIVAQMWFALMRLKPAPPWFCCQFIIFMSLYDISCLCSRFMLILDHSWDWCLCLSSTSPFFSFFFLFCCFCRCCCCSRRRYGPVEYACFCFTTYEVITSVVHSHPPSHYIRTHALGWLYTGGDVHYLPAGDVHYWPTVCRKKKSWLGFHALHARQFQCMCPSRLFQRLQHFTTSKSSSGVLWYVAFDIPQCHKGFVRNCEWRGHDLQAGYLSWKELK